MEVSMKVTLIAATMCTAGTYRSIEGTKLYDREIVWDDDPGPTDPDFLAEFAGRACYQSWDLPNEKTAENAGYLKNIIAQEHFTVLEHSSFTFYLEGVSRSLTHELVRHRHHSFSQLSQRYVTPENMTYVVPPALKDDEEAKHLLQLSWENSLLDYQALYERLKDQGLKKKEAAEAARSVLPNMTETKIVVTANASAWRHFIKKRYHPAADKEIQAVAREILFALSGVAPNMFNDLIPEGESWQ